MLRLFKSQVLRRSRTLSSSYVSLSTSACALRLVLRRFNFTCRTHSLTNVLRRFSRSKPQQQRDVLVLSLAQDEVPHSTSTASRSARASTRDTSRRLSSGSTSRATVGSSGPTSRSSSESRRETPPATPAPPVRKPTICVGQRRASDIRRGLDPVNTLQLSSPVATVTTQVPLAPSSLTFSTFSTCFRSSSVTSGASGSSGFTPGSSTGTSTASTPSAAATRLALSRDRESTLLTASSRRKSRKKEPSGDSTNLRASLAPPGPAGPVGVAVTLAAAGLRGQAGAEGPAEGTGKGGKGKGGSGRGRVKGKGAPSNVAGVGKGSGAEGPGAGSGKGKGEEGAGKGVDGVEGRGSAGVVDRVGWEVGAAGAVVERSPRAVRELVLKVSNAFCGEDKGWVMSGVDERGNVWGGVWGDVWARRCGEMDSTMLQT